MTRAVRDLGGRTSGAPLARMCPVSEPELSSDRGSADGSGALPP